VQFDPKVTKEFLALLETGVWDAEPELLADVISEVGSASDMAMAN